MCMVNFKYNLDDFNIEVAPVSRPLMPWRDEVLNTARNIAETTDRPIYLCHGGGIDGEVIGFAFLELGIKFTVLTYRHTQGTNVHDVRYAEHFCKRYNIPQKIVPLDVARFYKEDIPRLTDDGYASFKAYSYLQLLSQEHVESWGGCCVIGGGEQIYETIDNQICLVFDQPMVNAVEWCKRNNANHHPFFHMHNSELFASYMKIDLVDLLLDKPEYFENTLDNFSHEKIMAYHRYWKDMLRRPKFTGYEYIPRDLQIFFRDNMYLKYKDIQKDLRIPIATLKEQLGI